MDTTGAEPVRRRPLRAALLLAAAAVVTVGVVAIVNDLARPRIEANERAQRVAQLAEVLGGTRYDNDLLQDVVTVRDAERLGTDEPLPVYRARQAGRPVAAILTTVAPDGYAGSIRLLVGIGADGRLLGVRVVAHRETPGLGDAIDERKSDWIDGFKGRSLGNPALGALAREEGWRRLRPVHRRDRHAASRRARRAERTAVLRSQPRRPCSPRRAG